MVINTVSTLALHCSRCGKIQLHDISRFDLHHSRGRQFLCGCGQVQATVNSASSYQYLFSVPCDICETTHVIRIDKKVMGQLGISKLYCPQEKVELGFLGDRAAVEQTVAAYLNELDRLIQEMESDDFVQNPQIMFEILNKVHDIAEKGRIYCRCGHTAIEADILPDCIELKCVHCGGTEVIPAQTEADLAKVNAFDKIEISMGRRKRRKP